MENPSWEYKFYIKESSGNLSNILKEDPGAETSWEVSSCRTKVTLFQKAQIHGSKGMAMDIDISVIVVIIMMK